MQRGRTGASWATVVTASLSVVGAATGRKDARPRLAAGLTLAAGGRVEPD